VRRARRAERGRGSPCATTSALGSTTSNGVRGGDRALTTRVAQGLPRPRSARRARSRFLILEKYRALRRGVCRGVLDQRGFTLIELLVVIIVLGLLVGLVGPRLFGRVGQSKQAAARAQIELLGAALDQYRLDIGSYPNAGQGLDALNRNPNVNNWNGPYLKKAVPKDPWGNQYKYRCCPGQNGEYDLWSEGADGAPGGEGENADITSWDSSQK
jgi:general secretion pathway protein G